MTDYLSELIAQARGAESAIRPRLRLHFEPERGDAGGFSETHVEQRATAVLEGSQSSAAVRPVDDGREPAARLPTTAQSSVETTVRQDGVHHTHTHIVEHIDRRVEETVPVPPPGVMVREQPIIERTVERHIIERLQPVAVAERPPAPPASREPEPPRRPVEASAAPNVTSNTSQPEGAPNSLTARHPSIIVEARVAALEPLPTLPSPQIEAAPEITISIGVLDIRLTQETEPNRGRSAPLRTVKSDNTLALSDYLAKRSGGAS